MESTTKKFTFGKVDGYNNGKKSCLVELEVTLKYKDNKPVFTASGRLWNNLKTDIIQGGQCIDTLHKEYCNQLQNKDLYKQIMGLWGRNHLNDTNAGTEAQTNAVEAWKKAGNKYDYRGACEYLKSIGLYEVEHEGKPYLYGHGWIYREISNEDLQSIKSLLELA